MLNKNTTDIRMPFGVANQNEVVKGTRVFAWGHAMKEFAKAFVLGACACLVFLWVFLPPA